MNTKALNALAGVICRAQEQDRTPMGIAFAVDSAGMHMSPETAAELEQARLRVDEVERKYIFDTAELKRRIAALESERHTTNEALSDAAEALRVSRDREATVAGFAAKRAEYITSIRNCHPDNGHDYDRWQGHAAARRQLSELLGLPVAWPVEDAASVARSADKLTQLLAPTQAACEGGAAPC